VRSGSAVAPTVGGKGVGSDDVAGLVSGVVVSSGGGVGATGRTGWFVTGAWVVVEWSTTGVAISVRLSGVASCGVGAEGSSWCKALKRLLRSKMGGGRIAGGVAIWTSSTDGAF
jgi:hypothetical protein